MAALEPGVNKPETGVARRPGGRVVSSVCIVARRFNSLDLVSL